MSLKFSIRREISGFFVCSESALAAVSALKENPTTVGELKAADALQTTLDNLEAVVEHNLTVTAGADSVVAAYTRTLIIEIKEAGEGILPISASPNKALQMDKFEITALESAVTPELDYTLLRTLVSEVEAEKSESWTDAAALNAALAVNKPIVDNANTQKEIGDAVKAFHQAYLAARSMPSKDKLAQLNKFVQTQLTARQTRPAVFSVPEDSLRMLLRICSDRQYRHHFGSK